MTQIGVTIPENRPLQIKTSYYYKAILGTFLEVIVFLVNLYH